MPVGRKRAACLLFLLGAWLAITIWLCLQLSEQYPAGDTIEKRLAVETTQQALSLLGDRLPGPEYSLITTTLGTHDAKRLSLHPDFAAVAVELLHRGGIGRGDRVAVNVSGSFPGLNIAVLAAIQAIGAEPVLVSSVGASTWGATNPLDTWLDMEQSLLQAGIWPYHSSAASPGGVGDRGGGLSREGIALIQAAMKRNHIADLGSASVSDGVAHRLRIYRDSNGVLPAALVNVGGSHVIFGETGHAAPLRQGLSTGETAASVPTDSLAYPFLRANRPVIHFINIQRLAAQYGLLATSPPYSSTVFYTRRLNLSGTILAGSALGGSIAILLLGRRRRWWQGPCQ